MKRETKKRLSQKDLRALGVPPGLVVRRVPPPEGTREFARRLAEPGGATAEGGT